MERDESVEVCVILTHPDYDILYGSVNVEVFVDNDSIYIPSNVNRASKLNNNINCSRFIIMLPVSINT